MGIPVYFKSLIENYEHLLISDKYFGEYIIKYLFLDLNCAIHPCCHAVIKKYTESMNNNNNDNKDNKDNKVDTDLLEKEMMNEIFDKILQLLKIVKPTKLLYIAIDGVAPRAKMEQQRTRRYKTTLEERKIWNTNAITPGTKFMIKLGNFLRYRIKTDSRINNNNIIFSDSCEAGEGEHKILNYIRTDLDEGNIVIYGLDADLIMLSLIANREGIYLLREKTEFNFEGLSEEINYLYMNIDKLRELIIGEINPKNTIKIGDKELINDYIFLCFLLGNDFINNILSLNIRYNGLDHLLAIYRDIQTEYDGAFKLINDCDIDCDIDFYSIINRNNLEVLLEKLQTSEYNRLNEIKKIRDKQYMRYCGNFKYKKSAVMEERDKYVRNIPLLENADEKWISLNNSGWENRYYIANILKLNYVNKSSLSYINSKKTELSMKYIESLYWVANYYFLGKVIWDWYYPENYPPLLYDILNTFRENKDILKVPLTERSKEPYRDIEQLVIVFPPQSHYLIPVSGLNKIIRDNYKTYMFPETFSMDYMFKRYWWEAHPDLPKFEEEFLKKI